MNNEPREGGNVDPIPTTPYPEPASQPDPNTVIGVIPVAGNEYAPIPPELQKVIDSPDIRLQDSIDLMFKLAAAKSPGDTGVRMFGFDQTRCAMVFSGPEAEVIAHRCVLYIEAMLEQVSKQAEASARAAQRAAGAGDPTGALASIGIKR